MEPERIELSARERERLKVLHEVEQGHLKQIEAARTCGSSAGVRCASSLPNFRATKMDAAITGKRAYFPFASSSPIISCPIAAQPSQNWKILRSRMRGHGRRTSSIILKSWNLQTHALASDLRFEHGGEMTRIVDIFARLPDGSPMWIEAVEGLEKARARVRELGRIAPRDYFLLSEQKGRVQREEFPSVSQ